jgi:hypothetical protein
MLEKVEGNTTGTWDGFIYIISGDKGKTIIVTSSGDCNDKFLSLNDCLAHINCDENDTAIAIIEDYLNGTVYRYNNYGDKSWYVCGHTCGFA